MKAFIAIWQKEGMRERRKRNKFISEKEHDTEKRYSYLWLRYRDKNPPLKYHYDHMQEVIPDKMVRGSVGIDIGCGCGWDVFIMAKNNPSVRIIGMDISSGIYNALQSAKDLRNVSIIKGSAGEIPLKDETCDFVYSFGVLHHMADYKRGLLEINRILKKACPCFLYLYDNHSDNPIKYNFIKAISFMRRATVMLPSKILYLFSLFLSPVIVLLFTCPAKLFKKFKLTYKLYQNMPFNFGSSLFSLSGDLYDRFSAPKEHRFAREDLYKLFEKLNFSNIGITKLKATAGWVIWGYRNK